MRWVQSDDAASAAAAGGVAGGGISGGAVATVVLRASTSNLLDDVERAVDDGVNAYKVRRRSRRSARMLPLQALLQWCESVRRRWWGDGEAMVMVRR